MIGPILQGLLNVFLDLLEKIAQIADQQNFYFE